MDEKRFKLFPTLEKLLRRTNLSVSTLPNNLVDWKDFIDRINHSFYDFEQERYLLERSMEISSKEMLDLYQRLESAQSIAHIGYWSYNRKEDKLLWSKETYRLFGIDSAYPVPPFDKIMQMVHDNDRLNLSKSIDYALLIGEDFESEFRIINAADNKVYWMYMKGHPYKKKPDSDYLLSGIIMDITERKSYEKAVQEKELNEKLISIARRAGMSEIAISVLHNIGNVLNSVNISVSMLHEILKESEVKNLVKVSELITENIFKQTNYLVSDEKGKLIPKYLSNLSSDIVAEYNEMNNEIENLVKNVQHIKDIVIMQRDISGVSGINEKVFLPELMDLALQISNPLSEKYNINIIKQYHYDSVIIIDKSKMLQILVNLIQNAKESFEQQNTQEKNIVLSIQKMKTEPYIKLIVQDNGIGIPEENLKKIFTMGFTTKRSGHGFGLHSCALVANELGGTLVAKSEGPGKGARFILKIPDNVHRVL